MTFRWLKNYMPRSLYGRAALILVLPVVLLQLVVSIAFIQRHLEDVTTQMTLTMLREIRMIESQVGQVETQQDLLARMRPFLATLQIRVDFLNDGAVPDRDLRRWYDYTGSVIRTTIRQNLAGTRAILLPDNRTASVVLNSDLGWVQITLDRRRLSPAAPHQLITTMVAFGFLMTAIAFLYMRNQLRPITRLARAAQAFGRGRAEPYTPGGAIEVRAAGNAFLDMRARIERQIEQRTLMLSGVSHDLRTPLTRLKLGLAMLDEADAAPLLRDVEDMRLLLDAFLEFSRGAAEGTPEATDPVAMLTQVVSDARRAGRDVVLLPCEGDEQVMLRPMAIRRAVENLIGNAVRYGNRAEVSLALTPKSLRIRVEDDGPGIPEAQRQEAVRPFSRLDPARNQDRGPGVGLGLAIVADIARAHGGTLRLGRSDSLGGLRADIIIAR